MADIEPSSSTSLNVQSRLRDAAAGAATATAAGVASVSARGSVVLGATTSVASAGVAVLVVMRAVRGRPLMRSNRFVRETDCGTVEPSGRIVLPGHAASAHELHSGCGRRLPGAGCREPGARAGPVVPGSALRSACGGLGGLLVLTHLGERGLVDDVGHRPVRALGAVVAGRLAPARGLQAELLAEQREEDPGLLVAEARQRLEPAQHLGAVGVAGGPDSGGVAAV